MLWLDPPTTAAFSPCYYTLDRSHTKCCQSANCWQTTADQTETLSAPVWQRYFTYQKKNAGNYTMYISFSSFHFLKKVSLNIFPKSANQHKIRNSSRSSEPSPIPSSRNLRHLSLPEDTLPLTLLSHTLI